jgi:hypothetical protein
MATTTSKRTYGQFAEPNGTNSSLQPTKKPCQTTAIQDPSLLSTVKALDPAAKDVLLIEFALQSAGNKEKVCGAYQTQLKVEAAKRAAAPPVNFDHYSKSCWYTLNKTYSRMRPSQQFMMVGDISSELDDARDRILEQAGPDTKFETRRNALEVFRKISKSIMLCNEQQIRHEVMKDGQTLGAYADGMIQLANGMTVEERERYREEGYYEKLEDLQNECDVDTDMPDLKEVYAIFAEDLEVMEHEESRESERTGSDASADEEEIEELPPALKRTSVFSVDELAGSKQVIVLN